MLCLVLLVSAPGLLLPGGIDVRMCFCGGLSGECCMRGDQGVPGAREARTGGGEKQAGCPRCHAHGSPGRSRPITFAKADSRCPGCIRMTVPRGEPRATAPLPTAESVAPAVAQADLLAPST